MARKSRNTPRIKRKTLLFICEGKDDQAFLNHIKLLYQTKELAIRVRQPQGAGVIIGDAVKAHKNEAFDLVVIVRDKLPLLTENEKELRQGMHLILLEPSCLDCFLLILLDQKLPTALPSALCKKCKRKLEDLLTDPSEPESYKKLFSKKLLEDKRKTIKELDQILKFFDLAYVTAICLNNNEQ